MRMIRWLLSVEPDEHRYMQDEMPYGRVIVWVGAMLLWWLTVVSIIMGME